MPLVLDTSEYIPTQREEVRKEIDVVLDDFMEPLVDSTIIAEIKALGYAANMPQSFIDGVKFRKTEANKGVVINTWGTEEKPLAKWFNYGTTTHWIQPKDPEGVLAWQAGGEGSSAAAIFFRGESRKGDTLFSKGHYVAGVPRTEVMERGFQIGKKRLVVEAGKIVKDELE